MKISRRDFLKWSIAAAVALKLELDFQKINTVLAADTDPPVIWLQGAGCTGCSVSTLNVTNPTTIDDVLLNKLSMKFNNTVMAYAGGQAMQALEQAATQYSGQFILVVEGAIPQGASGNYCIIGELNGAPVTMQAALTKYGPKAKYVVAAGTCAAFGGISATAPNNTQAATVKAVLTNPANPVVNLPGCPVHPTIIVQTLVDLILTGKPALDSNGRPTKFFGSYVHSRCSPVAHCFYDEGCLGTSCYNICSSQYWNSGTFCTHARYPCIGCSSPAFPTNPLRSGVNDDEEEDD